MFSPSSSSCSSPRWAQASAARRPDPSHRRRLAWELAKALLKLGVLVVILLFAGSKIIPWIMVQVARLRSRELFTLTVLVMAITVAAGSSYLFGASMALGAFLAGMVVGQSPVSQQAAADALPMRDAFAVLFFIRRNALRPRFIIHDPLLLPPAWRSS
jgi:CPA2 family monovalent cation:H+ antiporter-2